MRYFLLSFFIIGCFGTVFSQKIVKAEYFLDSDMGIGKNTPIPIPSADQKNDVMLTINANLTTVAPGTHFLYLRVQDENKRWSIATQQLIRVITVPSVINIKKAEYFIDILPDNGVGTNIDISTPSADLLITQNIDLKDALPGLHILYIRVKDNSSQWSILSSQLFYVVSSKEIVKVKSFEYYFKGTSGNTGTYTFNNFTPGFSVELKDADFLANVSELEYDKQYTLYIRALNDNGKYSSYSTLQFTLKKLGTNIQGLQSSGLTIYPNPATDYIYLKGGESASNLEFFIYNQQGQSLANGAAEGNRIPVQDLPAGNYILVIKKGTTLYKGEVFIKK